MGVALSAGSKYGGSESLEVYDVLTGRETFSITVSAYASGYIGDEAGSEPLPALERLGRPAGKGVKTFALDGHGDIAWFGETEIPSGQTPQLVLYLHDRHGTRRVTAGPNITALAFSGTTLTWKAD